MAVVFYCSKQLLFSFVVAICLTVLVRESNGYPNPSPPWLPPSSYVFTESAACASNTELLDLCQRCSKLTRSRLAYPACCSNDIVARRWCHDFVYFDNRNS